MKREVPVGFDFYEDLIESGFQEVRLSGVEAKGLRNYPSLANHDPFDRVLLVTAESAGMNFVTADVQILNLDLPFVIDAQN